MRSKKMTAEARFITTNDKIVDKLAKAIGIDYIHNIVINLSAESIVTITVEVFATNEMVGEFLEEVADKIESKTFALVDLQQDPAKLGTGTFPSDHGTSQN
jgi:hypothetical protein